MKAFLRTAAYLLVILLVFTGSVSALSAQTKDVFLSDNGGEFVRYKTNAKTVAEFFKERDINEDDIARVNYSYDTPISDYLMIKVRRAVTVSLHIEDNDAIAVKTRSRTLEEFVREYSDETDKTFDYDAALAGDELTDKTEIYLRENFKTTAEEIVTLPYETVYVQNSDALTEEVVSAGEAGRRVIRRELSYEAGKLAETTVIYDKVETEPVKRIVFTPTDKSVSSSETETISYEGPITFKATAYTLAPCCVGQYYNSPYYGLTASGMKARVGVVAVDPKVIPLGTELYISGYGYAIAGDTGGAIKGNKVDLFFDTLAECYQFGARNVEVYVIK